MTGAVVLAMGLRVGNTLGSIGAVGVGTWWGMGTFLPP